MDIDIDEASQLDAPFLNSMLRFSTRRSISQLDTPSHFCTENPQCHPHLWMQFTTPLPEIPYSTAARFRLTPGASTTPCVASVFSGSVAACFRLNLLALSSDRARLRTSLPLPMADCSMEARSRRTVGVMKSWPQSTLGPSSSKKQKVCFCFTSETR